jgi:hypothetical protein
MDNQETPINRRERRQSRRSRAASRISAWWAEWVIVGGSDALRALLGLLSRPVEWVAWVVRRGIVWPLQDRGAELGAPARVLAAVGAALVVGVGIAATLSASSGGGEIESVSEPVAVAAEPTAAAEPAAKPEPQPQPTLQGAEPVFEPKKGEKQQVASASTAAPSAPADSDPATATIGSKPGSASSSSSASSGAPAAASASTAPAPQSAIGVDGPSAGSEALAVAEDFAAAFVLYETGGEESKVRKAFGATATPELAKSLLQRPPRLPANVEVPKARVVNVVAGPSQGGVYSVSVSLLRVGLTSELRLDMEKLKKKWRVTNVLG